MEENNKISFKYRKKLIDKIYILLPTFEGKDHIKKQVTYNKDIAFNNFTKNLNRLTLEIRGCSRNHKDVVEFMEMWELLEGLKTITIDEHDLLKQTVFHLIDVCGKIDVETEIECEN